MNTAHQPGSEPVQIPEQIPNPAVRPPAPEPKPGRRAPVELPRKYRRTARSSLRCIHKVTRTIGSPILNPPHAKGRSFHHTV